MKLKIFIHIDKIIVLCAVFLYTVASCSKVNNENANSINGKPIQVKEPIQLNWVGQWKNEGLKEKLMRDIARQFEFENPDIKVNMKFHQDIYEGKGPAEFNAEILTKQKSDWDLIWINDISDDLISYLNDKDYVLNYFVDLSVYPEIVNNHRQGIFDKEEFKKKWKNTIPGVAIDGADALLWCNTELAKKLGLNIKQFDMTLEDFLGYLKAVQDYNKANNTNIYAIFDVDGWNLLSAIPQQLYYSEIGSFETIMQDNLDDTKWAAFEKTIYACEKIAQYKPLPSDKTYTWDKDQSYPLKGNCLFYPQASYMYNIWLQADSAATKKMIPVQLPEFKPSQVYPGVYAIQWAIPKNSPHIQEAVRLMKYIATPQIADQWIRYTKSPTGIKNSIVSTSMGMDPYENFDYTINKKFGKTKVSFQGGTARFLGSKNAGINLDFHGLIEGKISANEFLNTVKKQLK